MEYILITLGANNKSGSGHFW